MPNSVQRRWAVAPLITWATSCPSATQEGGQRRPAVGRPALVGAVGLVAPAGQFGRGRPLVGLRVGSAREVGVDAEVGADALEDVVDVQATELGLEGGRPPPVVALERMVAEVDQPVAGSAAEGALVDHAGQTGDPLGEQPLARRPGHQPHRRPSMIRAWSGGKGDDQIAEPVGHGGKQGAAHAQMLRPTRKGSDPRCRPQRTLCAARRTCCNVWQ